MFYPFAMAFTGILSALVVYQFARMGQDLSLTYKWEKSNSKIVYLK